jgi:hypothetical protein
MNQNKDFKLSYKGSTGIDAGLYYCPYYPWGDPIKQEVIAFLKKMYDVEPVYVE